MKKINLIKIVFILLLGLSSISLIYAQGILGPKKYSLKLQVHYLSALPGDTINLLFSPQGGSQRITETHLGITDTSGTVNFDVPTIYPYGYITISKVKPSWKNGTVLFIDDLFWENTDNVSLFISDPDPAISWNYLWNIKCEGLSKEKYNTLITLKQAYQKILKGRHAKAGNVFRSFNNSFVNYNEALYFKDHNKMKSLLDKRKTSLSAFAYEVLRNNIKYIDLQYSLSILKNTPASTVKAKGIGYQDSLLSELTRTFLPIPKVNQNPMALAASSYFNAFYSQLLSYIKQLQSKEFRESEVIETILSQTDGVVAESLIVAYLDIIGYNADNKDAYTEAFKHIQSPYYRNQFYQVKSKCDINVHRYDFLDTNNSKISLKQFKGKLLFLDTWFTGCSGCLTYYKNVIAHIEEEFKGDNRLQIISICLDKNEQTWKKSLYDYKFNTGNILNLYTSGLGMKHPFLQEVGIYSSPTPMLIDQDGNTIDFDSFRLRDLTSVRSLINRNLK